ncbi:hypothetical protein [uncultured Chryseobacterium sp.]|uniref:hypothetical protein n=1 Tax=uncultured Chryseobacterium sp. TaxID=259322 RepID=UPI0025FB11FE|nr:hypothetical protein [uncultured Chryseobacterium sp.]
MKKLFLMAITAVSGCLSAQSFIMQNYTPHKIAYTLNKQNLTNVSGGCTPTLEARTAPNDHIWLPPSPNPGIESLDAKYDSNLNLAFSATPPTPPIGRVIINSNYNPPYIVAPSGAVTGFSNVTTYSFLKFGVTDVAGNNIGGYYTVGQQCGGAVVPDLSGYPSPAVNASYFTLAGDTWVVFY